MAEVSTLKAQVMALEEESLNQYSDQRLLNRLQTLEEKNLDLGEEILKLKEDLQLLRIVQEKWRQERVEIRESDTRLTAGLDQLLALINELTPETVSDQKGRLTFLCQKLLAEFVEGTKEDGAP